MCSYKFQDICEPHTIRKMQNPFWARTLAVWRPNVMNECEVRVTVITSQEITHTSPTVMHQISVLFPGEVVEDSFEAGCVLRHLSQRALVEWMLSAAPHCHPLNFPNSLCMSQCHASPSLLSGFILQKHSSTMSRPCLPLRFRVNHFTQDSWCVDHRRCIA